MDLYELYKAYKVLYSCYLIKFLKNQNFKIKYYYKPILN